MKIHNNNIYGIIVGDTLGVAGIIVGDTLGVAGIIVFVGCNCRVVASIINHQLRVAMKIAEIIIKINKTRNAAGMAYSIFEELSTIIFVRPISCTALLCFSNSHSFSN